MLSRGGEVRDGGRAGLQAGGHLAEAETNPDVRTVLMGMALGWLTLASEKDAQSTIEDADRLV
jgi:hypothetical protein